MVTELLQLLPPLPALLLLLLLSMTVLTEMPVPSLHEAPGVHLLFWSPVADVAYSCIWLRSCRASVEGSFPAPPPTAATRLLLSMLLVPGATAVVLDDTECNTETLCQPMPALSDWTCWTAC